MVVSFFFVEEAIRLKEKKIATEIVAVSIGPKPTQDVLRHAMALGVDRSIHIETNLRTDQELSPLAVAKTLKHFADVIHILNFNFLNNLVICLLPLFFLI